LNQVINEIEFVVVHIAGDDYCRRASAGFLEFARMRKRNQLVLLAMHKESRTPNFGHPVDISKAILEKQIYHRAATLVHQDFFD
jgi:hypothetical protein